MAENKDKDKGAEAQQQGAGEATATSPGDPAREEAAIQQAAKADTLWVHSNRQDNRTVLNEQDPRHPMQGWAFVGGDGPALVYRTPAVERLLRSGELVEIPEPPDGRQKPLVAPWTLPLDQADQPGQPIRLGRELPETIVPAGARREVERKQAEAGTEIPVPAGVVMPEAPPQR